MKFFLISFFFFYLLALLQTSFFPFLGWLGFVLYIAPFLVIIFVNLFERPYGHFGFILAFLAGFFVDLFFIVNYFDGFFGFYTFSFMLLSIMIKLIVKKYFQLPSII